MREHLTPVSTIKQKGSAESCKEITMNTSDALRNFVDQLNAPVFPTLEDFNASWTNEALKWTDLVQDTVYQIVSTRTVNTQHRPSIIVSLQKADGSCCIAWACGMLTKLKPYGDELVVICIQFISTAAVLMVLSTEL